MILAFVVGLIVAGAAAFIMRKKTQVERLQAESDLKSTIARLTTDKEHLLYEVDALRFDKDAHAQRAHELNLENIRLQTDLKELQDRLDARAVK